MIDKFDIVKNISNAFVQIVKLVIIFFFALILFIVVFPTLLRIYFHYFPITEKEYEALARFVLYSTTILLMLYFSFYLYKRIRFKLKRLEDITLLHRSRIEKKLKEEENKEKTKEKAKENISENTSDSRVVEINNVIIPDTETCKKIIISEIEKQIDSNEVFAEKKKVEMLNFILDKFDGDYKKAYYSIIVKREYEL